MLTHIHGPAATHQIAALRARIGHHNGDTTLHDGDHGVEWLTGRDSDQDAFAAENAKTRWGGL